MSQKHLESSRSSIESCTSQLLSWRPFNRSKTLDSSDQPLQKPYSSNSTTNGFNSTPKRPCFSDRSTSFSIEALSRLSLADDDNGTYAGGKTITASNFNSKGSFRLVARKRRRRNSRSVSGRSSDRSGTRRCCSIGAHGTCSDFPFAIGTDSSGEIFSETNWASDVSEAARNSRRERRDSGGEKEASGYGFAVGIDPMGNESGYGSEPGYRGDAEFGYGDEFDDEEEDVKPLFWGDTGSTMEMSGDTKFSDSKPQFRCRRRRQHDYKTIDSMRLTWLNRAILDQAQTDFSEWSVARKNLKNNRLSTEVKTDMWKSSAVFPSTSDHSFTGYKCYVDASSKDTNHKTGLRWVCFSDSVEGVQSGAREIFRSLSALHAEVEAVLWALESLLMLQITDVEISTDSKTVMKILCNPEEWPAFSHNQEEFAKLNSLFSFLCLSIILRSLNHKVDVLARAAKEDVFDLVMYPNF